MNNSIQNPHANRLVQPAVAFAFGAAVAVSALAQGADSTSEAFTLEEVVVTVSRVEQSIQDVPVAVNVISGESFQDLRIDTIGDALKYTPSASFGGGSPDQTSISIRGIDSDIYGASGDAAVVSMIDQTVISRSWMRTGNFFDMNRVEIARGPQGTTFGRNSTGGVVHFVTNRPVLEREGSIGVEAGNLGYQEATAVLNQPINATTAARVSAYYQARDGYYTREGTGESLENKDVKAVRLQLLSQPSDSREFLVRANYSKDHLDVASPADLRFFDIPVVYLSPALINYRALDNDPRTVGATPGQFFDRKMWDVGLDMSFGFGDLSLSSITNYRHGRVDTNRDGWGTTSRVFRQESFEDADVLQQEVRLDNSAAKARATWVTGVFYLHEDTQRWEQKDIMVGFPQQTFQSFFQKNTTDSFGLFGNMQYDLTDATTLSAGARYSNDKKDYTVPFHVCSNTSNPTGIPNLGSAGAICAAFMQNYAATIASTGRLPFISGGNDASWDDVSYRVSLSHKIGGWNLYSSYSTGYKGGGFGNEPNNSLPDSFRPYDPEEVATVEIGAKGSLFSDRLRLDLAVYDSDYKSIQAETIVPSTGSAITFNAIGGATIRGAEAQFDWRATENLTLRGVGNYLDASYNPPGLVDPTGQVLSEGRFFGQPFWNGFVSGSYAQKLGNGSSLRYYTDVRFGGDIQNELVVAGNALNGRDDNYAQDTLLGANVTWTNAAGNVSVQLWGRNLTDEDDIQALSSPTVLDRTHLFYPGRFQGIQRLGAPRTFGLNVNYSWK